MKDDDGSRLILSAGAVGSLLALLSLFDVGSLIAPGWPDGFPLLLALIMR
jgi:hypothetical protein